MISKIFQKSLETIFIVSGFFCILVLSNKTPSIMQQLTSVKITYISYQSISRDEAASIYSVIVDIIRPLERLFKLSEVTGKVIEIEPTSRQNIERTLELDNYVPSSNPQFHLLKFEFESFTLHIDPDPDEPKYYIEEK